LKEPVKSGRFRRAAYEKRIDNESKQSMNRSARMRCRHILKTQALLIDCFDFGPNIHPEAASAFLVTRLLRFDLLLPSRNQKSGAATPLFWFLMIW
jgi:hypothetical protein